MAGSLVEGTAAVTPGEVTPASPFGADTDALVRRLRERRSQERTDAAVTNTLVAAPQNPDALGPARAAAREIGLPVELADKAPEEVTNEARRRRIQELMGSSPATAGWMTNPANARIAHDSVENLSSIERLSRAFQLGRAQNEAGRAGEQAFLSPLSEAAQARLAEADQRVKALGDDAGLFTAQGWLNTAATAAGQIVDTLTSQRAAAGLAVGAAAGAAVVVTAPVTVPAAATLAAATGLAATGYVAGQVVDTVGVAIGTSYADLREAGVRDDYARGLSLVAGTTIGAIEAVADRIGFSLAARSLGSVRAKVLEEAVGFLSKRGLVESAKSAGRLYAQNLAIQAGTEFVQEIVQVSAEEVGKVLTDPNLRNASAEEIAERVGTAAVKGFQAAVVLGAPGAVAGYRADRAERQSAQRNHEALTDVNKELNASPLAQRDREAAIDHAKTILPEVGIPADRFIEVIQQKQLLGLVEELGVADQIEKALETGADIRLSPEQHARLQLSEAGRDMLDHVRVDPNGLTLAESKEIQDTGVDEEVAAAAPAQETQGEPLTATQRADLIKMGFTEADLEGATSVDYEALRGEGKLTKPQKNFLLSLGFTQEQADQMKRADFEEVQRLAPAGTMADPNNPSLADAEALMGFQAMLRDAKNLGMSAGNYTSYLQAIAEAKQEATNRIERLRLREEQKRLTAEYQALADLERATATAEVDSRPVFALLTSISPTEKINRDSLISSYIDEMTPDQQTVARRSKGFGDALLAGVAKAPNGELVYTTKADKAGGLPAPFMAQKYGFSSVKEMVAALKQLPNRTLEIMSRTDELMRQKHPEVVQAMSDTEIALEALHNNKAGAVILQEVNALRREQGRGTLRYSVLKQSARQRFAQFRLSDVSPNKFVNAERRKARETGTAIRKNDRRTAATRAFERLLNFEWVREAYRWQKEIAADRKFITKVYEADRSRSGANISEAADYFDAAKLVLSLNGIGREIEPSFDRQEAIDLIRDDLIAERSSATMTVGEWRTVIDEARRLIKAGQDASKVAVGKSQEDLEATVNRLVETASALKDAVGESPRERALGEGLGSLTKATRKLMSWGDAFAGQVEFMLRRLDNGVVAGQWYKTLFQPLVDAQFRSFRMKETLEAHFGKLADHIAKHEKRGAFVVQGGLTVDGLPRHMTLQERVMLALNMGNASNLDKTTRGFGTTEAQLVAEVSALPAEIRQWVQQTWDIFEGFRPEVEAVYRSKMGKSPEMIQPIPLKFADGETIRGGYFPMMYDPRAVANRDAALAPDKASATGVTGGDFAQDVVFSGMTKERTEFAAEVALDIGRVSLAIDSVVHYVTHFEAVNSVKRVLRQTPVKNVVQTKLGVRQYEMLGEWISDVARDGDHAKLDKLSEEFRPAAELIRRNIVVAAMAYSATALLAQTIGFTTSIAQLGRNPDGTFSKGATRFLRGVIDVVSSPKQSVALMAEKSPLMRDRIRTADQAIGEQIDRLKGRSGYLSKAALFGMTMIPKVQFYAADAPTWMAAYSKALGEGRSDGDAVQYADSVVRTAQGGGGNLALSRQQRSQNPVLRVTTMFATYPTILYNNIAEAAGDVRQSPKAVNGALTRLFYILVVGAVLDTLRQGAEPKEEEEPAYFWMKRLLANIVSAVPVFGDTASSAILGFRNADSAIATMVNAGGGVLNTVNRYVAGDIDEGQALPRIAKDAGILLGVPGSAQAGRTLEAFFSDADLGPYDYLTGPPKK